VPLRLITHEINDMGHELASCVAPDGEDYDAPYAILGLLAVKVLLRRRPGRC
jgi:hypothetical protein